MIEEKLRAWLARAGGDIEEMDNEVEPVGCQERPRIQDLPAIGAHQREEEAECIGVDLPLMASMPCTAHGIGLSHHVKEESPPPVTRHGHHKRRIGSLRLNLQDKGPTMPDLISNSLNKHQNPYVVSPKLRTTSEHSTQASIRHLLNERSSKRLKFRLIVHPPAGERLENWRRLRKSETEKDYDDRFLMPPPKQQTKAERKKPRRTKKEHVREVRQTS